MQSSPIHVKQESAEELYNSSSLSYNIEKESKNKRLVQTTNLIHLFLFVIKPIIIVSMFFLFLVYNYCLVLFGWSLRISFFSFHDKIFFSFNPSLTTLGEGVFPTKNLNFCTKKEYTARSLCTFYFVQKLCTVFD